MILSVFSKSQHLFIFVMILMFF